MTTLSERRSVAKIFAEKLVSNPARVRNLGIAKLGLSSISGLVLKQASFSDIPQLLVTDTMRGYSPYTIYFQMNNGLEKDVLLVTNQSGAPICTFPFLWSGGEYEDAIVLLEAVLDLITAVFRKPVSSGCVQVFFEETHKVFWVSKRPSSDKIVKYKDNFYIVENNPMFVKINNFVTGAVRYVHTTEITTETRRYNGEYFEDEGFVNVYANQIPFSRVTTSVPQEIAERTYETVIVDGETRFINVEKEGTAYFKKGIHSYNVRIEQVVEADKLFLKGTNDLYAKREVAETPFLGWELEACSNLSSLPKEQIAIKFKEQLPFIVMCKEDGSISPAGFETVSVPATLDAWKETELSNALDVMRVKPYSMRSFEHSSTGFHVHVSRSALSVLDLQKLERFMHNPANRDFLSSVAGRGPVSYAKYNDKMFSARKSAVPSSATRPGYTLERGINFFGEANELVRRDFIDYYGTVAHYTFSKRWALFYSFSNNYVSFQSMHPAIASQDPELAAELEALSVRYGYPNGFDLWNYMNRYLLDQHDLLRRLLFALSAGRPSMTKITQYYFPELNIPTAIPEVVVAPTSSSEEPTPVWKTTVSNKAKLATSRQHSYAAARSIKGPVGKGEVRYDVLNTSNKSTIEFRLFKGTMNPSTVFRYLEFVDALVRFVATTSATDEGVNFKTFIKFLVGDTFNVSRYENLVAFLLSKKYIERVSIKKRTIVDIGKADGDVNKIVTAKVLKIGGIREPLYSISTRAAAERSFENTPVTIGLDNFVHEEEPDYEGEDDVGCQCPDCRAARGED